MLYCIKTHRGVHRHTNTLEHVTQCMLRCEPIHMSRSESEDLMELLTPEQIGKGGENIVPFNTETVRRYIRDRVLFRHAVTADGRSQLCYRGSVLVRYKTVCMLRTKDEWRKLSLKAFGNYFYGIGGGDDEFILSRLKNNIPIDSIVSDFKNAVERAKTGGDRKMKILDKKAS